MLLKVRNALARRSTLWAAREIDRYVARANAMVFREGHWHFAS